VHERERPAAEPSAAERASAPASRASGALALQRQIGNRAFGAIVARTPEDSAELLDPAINGAHVDVEQINRTLLPYSRDQESFDKVAEAYETKAKQPLKAALESRLAPEDMFEVEKRVPWRGFPPPKDAAAG
jgi:hypothetical protein